MSRPLAIAKCSASSLANHHERWIVPVVYVLLYDIDLQIIIVVGHIVRAAVNRAEDVRHVDVAVVVAEVVATTRT